MAESSDRWAASPSDAVGGVGNVQAVSWLVSDAPVEYRDAVTWMDVAAGEIARGERAETIWLLEHPPVYTAGTSADVSDLKQPDRFPVISTGRGGQYTYHGPGQRVVYVLMDLNRRGRDVRAFVHRLEAWIITALAEFNVHGAVRPDRVGVWVKRSAAAIPPRDPGVLEGEAEDKIAAIGVRVRKWVTMHGFSINVAPDLEHFSGIVPCGIVQHGVTSLEALGLPVTLADVDVALRATFADAFE